MSSSATTMLQGEGSGTESQTRGVTIILHHLPFDLEEDDFHEIVPPESLPSLENLAGIYHMPLDQILSSALFQAGLVHGIYVKFGAGYFYLNPSAAKPVTQPAFIAQLYALVRDEIVVNPDNRDEVIWKSVGHLSCVRSRLPLNSQKIACLHGPTSASREFAKFSDYIDTAPAEQHYVFVVGKIDAGQEIRSIIDNYLQVSDYDLAAHTCLSRVIMKMEAKWGIP